MDRAIAVSWYNIHQDRVGEYLAWAHDAFIPKMLARAGVQWGAHYKTDKHAFSSRLRHTTESVPNGDDYIMLFGGDTAHVFTKDAKSYAQNTTDRFTAALSAQDTAMLALRKAERKAILTEEARIDGPEAKSRGSDQGPAPYIQLGSFNASPVEVEEELLAWYADWRMQALGETRGCMGLRKYVSTVGWAKHSVLYEFTSRATRDSGMASLSSRYPEMEAWSERCIPKLVHAPGSPHIGLRLWPAAR
jgi:hypothetical protein